jgi:GTPase
VARAGSVQSKDMWQLGLGEPLPVSAANGRGLGDLLDLVFDELTKAGKPPAPFEDTSRLHVVIMGRPNVGKSSIMNAILGEERSIVSPLAHTTREPLDTEFEWGGQKVTLVDTAGMRKRAHITERLEHQAIERNRQALSRADVAVLVIDATEDPRKQDKILAGLLMNANKGLILVVNKWDLVDVKDTQSTDKFAEEIRQTLPFLAWAPILFTSAKDKQRMQDILKLAFRIKEERQRVIEDNALHKFLKHMIAKQTPRAGSGNKAPYIGRVVQTGVNPPTFLMTLRGTKVSVHNAWMRFFENQLRAKFGFVGTPLVFNVEVDSSPQEKMFTGPHKKKRAIGRKGMRY